MKHTELLNKLTTAEKAALLSGKTVWETWDIPRLHIPSIWCSDGPNGVRRQMGAADHLGLNASLPATCFPTAATVANSWDEKLAEKVGQALGEEAAEQGVDVLLGPGLNIKRSPLCGRNFEYFSEDPYLSGKMAAAYVRGIQSRGVYACPKHFAVNSQELRRMAMNSVLDERTLRELYLTGFEIAVKEGRPGALMTSYNEVNGVYANENEHLLKEILRGEWGFDGIVITDWGGSNDHVKGVKAGSDLEMPSPGLSPARELVAALEEGSLSMEELDACADRVLDAALTLAEKKGQNDPVTGSSGGDAEKQAGADAHHETARRAAAESIVLLKNQDSLLPLAPGTSVALIGDFAFTPRYQGAGSSVVNARQVDTMEGKAGEYGLLVKGIVRGYARDGEENAGLAEEAAKLAKAADVVLYCFGLPEISESEGLDRTDMKVPQNQISLLQSLTKANKNIVGILSAGASVEMPWEACCSSILHGYLGGEAGASAMMDVLTGAVNPSGHLAESYPMCYEDTPACGYYPAKERDSQYREGLYVGYRYYDTASVPVRYPFGFGFSYTSFSYEALEIGEGGVSFTLSNTGGRDGAEVAQLYVGLPGARVFRPKKELKGFQKVFLKAGESRRLTIPFDDKTFRYWNEKTGQWEIEGGVYQILVGASSADIRLSGEWKAAGTTEVVPYDSTQLPSYYSGKVQSVPDAEFAALLGRPIPEGKWSGRLGANDAICQMYYAKSGLARLVYRILTSKKEKSEAKGKPDLNILFIYNMPFRGIAKMTNGMVEMDMVQGVVTAVNGRFFRGLGQAIGAFFRNRREDKKYRQLLEKQ